MAELFLGLLTENLKEVEEKTQFLTERKGTKRDYFKEVINSWSGYFTIIDLEIACPSISRNMIRLVLKDLRDAQELL